jgi:hypothetical protein
VGELKRGWSPGTRVWYKYRAPPAQIFHSHLPFHIHTSFQTSLLSPSHSTTMMNFKLLSFSALLVAASSMLSVAAADGRQVVTHQDTETWCADNHWDQYCDQSAPVGANVILSSCTKGDKAGRNPTTQSTVFCSVGNLDIPGQETWITGFVVSMAGAVPIKGGAPKDTTEC